MFPDRRFQANSAEIRQGKTLLRIGGVCLLIGLATSGCEETRVAPTPPSPAATQVSFTVQPSSILLSGSTVTITARARDEHGTNVVRSPVTFTSNVGTLSATSVLTDQNGFATVDLSASDAAYVTATTTNTSGAISIPAVAPYSVSVAPAAAVTVNVPAVMRVTVSPNTSVVSPPGPSSVLVSCGTDGAELSLQGRAGEQTTPCTFPGPGAYTVRASAPAANGWAATGTTNVSVGLAVLEIRVSFGAVTPPKVTTTLATSPAVGAVRYVWSFGDGSADTTTFTPTVVHDFPDSGGFQVRLTATDANGTTVASGSTIVGR